MKKLASFFALALTLNCFGVGAFNWSDPAWVAVRLQKVSSLPSPAFWWKLNEGTGTTLNDSSGNGYSGTVSGTYTWTTLDGVTALNLSNGSATSTATAITQINGVQQATICGWVNVSSSSTVNWGILNAATGSRFGMEISNASGNSFCVCENGAGANYPYLTGTNGIHFFALVFDGTQATAANRLTIYIDAVQQTLTQAGAGNPTSLPNWTTAGSGNFVLGNPFTFADTRIYSTALTQSQIAAVMAGIQ